MTHLIVDVYYYKNTEKRYDDEIIKYQGLPTVTLHHGNRQIKGTHIISYKYLLCESLFLIDESETDLIHAIGWNAINCSASAADIKSKTGLTVKKKIYRVQKRKYSTKDSELERLYYSDEFIDNSYVGEFPILDTTPIKSKQDIFAALILPIPLAIDYVKPFITTNILKILLIISFAFFIRSHNEYSISNLFESSEIFINTFFYWYLIINLGFSLLFLFSENSKVFASLDRASGFGDEAI